ncbi:MAG TPA: tetratricopeptide repeat protein [Terriglobia bacterium]|nr:tetratricopeptide repeat protein [Terriglobia bacterium]
MHYYSSAKFRTVILCLLGAGAAAASGQQQMGGITGQVRSASGQVIRTGVEVRLETPAGTLLDRQPCDSDGRYQFPGLTQSNYRIVVTAEGYQTHQEDVDLTNAPRLWTVNIYLNPLTKTAAAVAPSVNDAAAPKEARKDYEKGAQALQEKRYGEARKRFEKALAEYPCYARAKTDLAVVSVAERKLMDAEQQLKQASECDAGYVDAYLKLGELYNVEKRFAESEAPLSQGLRRSPGDWQFYYELGTAQYGQQHFKEAESFYLKAQSFNADMPPEFHAKLANVYVSMGAYDRAYREMQTYLRADPKGVYADSIRKVAARMQSAGVLTGQAPAAGSNPSPKP